jgi:hypothetical protein
MLNDGLGSTEQLACACDIGGTIAAGEQTVMADGVEALGQHVDEESPGELARVQGHRLPPVGSVDAVILPAEGDAVKRGRMTEDELVIFDSSGSGVQDVAAAWLAYRECRRTGIGGRFDLSGAAMEQ